MPPSQTYTLVGVRTDGTNRTIAEDIPSFTEAERIRKAVKSTAENDGYATVIVRSKPKA